MKTKRHKASLFTLLSVSLLLACFAFLATTVTPAHAVTTTPTTMNFQGRLADSSGNIMPDGLYNMQFRLFTASSGGSAVWSETRENNGTDYRVQVTNGLFSTKLGQVSPLSASLFASGSLYFEITMATPATATCSTASCASWESPMTPRHQLSTSAYAYNAETLDGYDSSYFATATGASGYIQNTTTPQTADFSITGTGTANIFRATTFDRATAGILTVGGTNATSITLADSTTLAAGNSLQIVGGTTASRPASPTEGMVYYDTTTKQLLTYSNGKWQSDSKTASFIVAASNSSQTVKDGAQYVADGTADEVEINAAIAALPASNGVVYLAEGTYNLSARVNMNKAGVKLLGSGYGALLNRQFNSASAEGLIHITVSSITVQDVRINGNKATYTSTNNNNINIAAGTKQKIVNNWIYDSAGANVTAGGYAVGENAVIKDNEVYGSLGDGMAFDAIHGAVISNNLVYSNGDEGIYVSSPTYRVTITNNRVSGNTGNGIRANAQFAIVTDNRINDNGGYGIFSGKGGNITGNMVMNNDSGIIVYNGTELVNVTSNTVALNTNSGIVFDSSGGSTSANIESNYVYDNGSHGIFLGNTPNNVTVVGNRISNNGGTGSSSGIYSGSSGSVYNLRITSNDITDTEGTGYAINLSGANIFRAYLADNTYSGTGASKINDLGSDTMYSSQMSSSKILQSASTLIRAGSSSTLSGTAATNGTTTLTGSGTSFLSSLEVGYRITVNAQTRTITAIASNTSLTVDTAFTGTGSGYTITRLPAALIVQNSSSVNTLEINDVGSATFRNSANSTTAFQVQNAAGGSLLNVDSTTSIISIGPTNQKMEFEVGAVNHGIEMGRTDGTSSTPYVDFHSGATATSYDARIIAYGGDGTDAGGTLTLQASVIDVTDELNVVSNVYAANEKIWLRDDGSTSTGIEMGGRQGISTNSYIDFHSDGSGVSDYNARIITYDSQNTLRLISSGGQTCSLGTSWSCTSDEKLKNIQGSVDDNLSKILQLDPVYYTWKADTAQKLQIGLVAQDVQQQYPELVDVDEDGTLSLSYQNLVAPLIGAVKEQQAQIEQTQTMVASLQGGGIENGGAISGNLTVSGDTILTNLNVNGVTTLAGLVAVGTAQVQTLDVIESAKVQGELTVTGATNVKDIYVNGHIVSIGEKPTITTGEALGSIGSDVVIDGTDGAGTITAQAADVEVADGVLAHVKFNTAYNTDYKVVISPSNAQSVKLGAYVAITADGFDIIATNPLSTGTEYKFNYIVQGIQVIE